MTIKNRYQKKLHITTVKFREILRYFSEDFSATTTAKLCGISRDTINKFFNFFRMRMVKTSLEEQPELGDFELDESYFGAKRIQGKSHVNGIESFWSFTKRRLSKFNGLSDHTFNLHRKESEFRWNYRNNKKLYLI